MDFHEKSLELNITHELLNLADSGYWFLNNIAFRDNRLWLRKKLRFLKFPKSTAGGFHITTEGKNDPTGNAGGGYDVRIKTGVGSHLLFIQYKKGDLTNVIPNPTSEFAKAPHEHFVFKINSTSTNQHFVLRDLANGIGKVGGNAVVYAFPLISDMIELEANAGKLLRKTKFISITDIDKQAAVNKVKFTKNKEHNFRVGKLDLNRCEVNFFFFFFDGKDKAPDIIADIISLKFEKALRYFIKEIQGNYENYDLLVENFPLRLRRAFIEYVRYLLHYFEVSPTSLTTPFLEEFMNYFFLDEFKDYENAEKDILVLSEVFNGLSIFYNFITSMGNSYGELFTKTAPEYKPKILFTPDYENGLSVSFEEGASQEAIEDVNYLSI